MPAKYSHVKRRTTNPLLKKASSATHASAKDDPHARHGRKLLPSPHADKSLSRAMSAVSDLERAIAKILLIRYEQDIARLFSTRLYSVALVYLPRLVSQCVSLCGPTWLAHNHDCDEIKDFLRAAMSMDMRQAGERVATKSVLWSYTALRHFAMSNNVPICTKRGLHSLHLLPYYSGLKTHLDTLEAMPIATFSKPPHLGNLQEGIDILEDACEVKFGVLKSLPIGCWDDEWKEKVRYGYEKLVQTLWRVSREFDVRGYGVVLREKLTTKWCDCGCSTDHLGEVCERTVREDEEESGVRIGKQREWDGRGSGVYGWETEEEEDIWEVELDFGGFDPDEPGGGESEMTIGELMEWRYFKAEREKEDGNIAFRKGNFALAIKYYEKAYGIESELPHYQLNLAAAHLKLNNWIEAEKACTKALSQHRSSKGFYRRARARRMLNRPDEAMKDLRAVLRLQPNNVEALAELAALLGPEEAIRDKMLKEGDGVTPNAAAAANSSPSQSSSSIPPRKQPKQPPWPRTRADDRKLKIVLTPALPSELGLPEHPIETKPHRRREDDDAEKSPLKGKARDRKSKLMEMEEIVRSETVIYPSWDRYIIKTVD